MVTILSTLVYIIFGVLVLQIIYGAFGTNPSNAFLRLVVQKDESCSYSSQSYQPIKKDLIKVFFCAFLLRIIVLLISFLAVRMFMEDSDPLQLNDLIDHYRQWDVRHYIGLADKGYANLLEDGKPLFLVFFPLYSWMMRILHVFISDYAICGLTISCLCYCFGCCFLYTLVANDYGKGVAKKSVVYLSVFPFAFFFGGIMTESLFFLTSVASLYCIRKHNWMGMMLWGMFCSLTRMHGILLCIAGAVEMIMVYEPFKLLKSGRFKEFFHLLFTKVIYLFGITIGTLIYLWINYDVTGNPFMFTVYQKENWSQGSTWFTNTLTYISKNAFTSEHMGMIRASIWIPEFVIFLIGLLTIIYGLKRHHNTYVSYLFVYLLLNYSLTWAISCGRYMSCCVPMFVIWAEFAERHELADRAITIISTVLFGIYLTGYLFSKQIM